MYFIILDNFRIINKTRIYDMKIAAVPTDFAFPRSGPPQYKGCYSLSLKLYILKKKA